MDLNRNQQIAAVALVGLALIGLSVGLVRSSFGGNSSDIEINEPAKGTSSGINISVEDTVPGDKSNSPAVSIVVHVAGRVRFPNVYRLAPDSRAMDAVKAAGGALPDAYLDAVNLAAKVKDGEQVYIPSRQTARLTPAGHSLALGPRRATLSQTASRRPSASRSTAKLSSPGQGVVNINTADSDELQRLPGVGPSTAQKIADYRSQIGRFTSIDQLMDVKGIGPKKLEKMRPFVAL
jgi:competence protein ComEA